MAARKADVYDVQKEKLDRSETRVIRIPKVSGEDPTFFVGINGQNYLIPRGKATEVPEAVAQVYDEYLRTVDVGDEYAENEQRRMNKVEGAPV